MDNTQNEEALEVALRMMETNYINMFNKTTEDEISNLFPMNWFSFGDNSKKIDILIEAITKKIMVIDTDGYQDIIEGVKEL